MAQPQHTRILVASFNDYSAAKLAERDLQNNGVASDAIKIESDRKTAGAGSGGRYREEHQESGFFGWWNSLFGSDDDNEERGGYERALESGSTIMLVTVAAGSVDAVVDILNRNGAVDVDRRSGSDSMPKSDGKEAARSEDGGTIQVVEEELQVGKRAIRRGGVRIYSHVVTEPVEEQVKLREEHIDVQRRQVNREIRPEETAALRDQTIEVTETAEEPVVSKRARVREEIVISKESKERTETVRDNLRRTEVEVEPLSRESATTSASRKNAPEMSREERKETYSTHGLSVDQPSPGVQSGSGMTAGAGTLAGEATAGSAIRNRSAQDFTTNDFTSDYRRDFDRNYGSDTDFETMRPAYEYGYRNAGNEAYRRVLEQVQDDLRGDYERRNPGSSWDRVKGAVRYGREKVSGQR